MNKLEAALDNLAATIVAEYPSDHMTCSETNALAEVLAAGGYQDAALAVLYCHAMAEEEYDSHYPATQLIDAEDEDGAMRWLAEYLGKELTA